MFLAPLNYDRFFKKVFSDRDIAKRFIEDILDTSIDHIEPLSEKHKVTDDAAAIEFDYRCKIGNQYIVVDMQQWYKPDIVKRFYLYHCVSSALQLSMIPSKSLSPDNKIMKQVKDYRKLEPVVTIVWLVDETLGTEEDFLTYILTPEVLTDYVQKEELWHSKNVNELLAQRTKMLALLNNRTKNLDFLAQNKLIFTFQKNIVRGDKVKRYVNWYTFAEKTRNQENTETDFTEYSDDKIFAEIMRRINTKNLVNEDYTYIKDFRVFAEEHKRWEEGVREEGIEIGVEKGIEKGARLVIRNVILRNPEKSDKEVADMLGVSVEIVAQVRNLI